MTEKEQAWEMARLKVNQTQTGKPEVSEFLFDETLMNSKELNVLTFPDYSKEWALFVLANRDKKKPQPTHNYDIVYGPIADDKVGVQLWKYENQSIDLRTLVNNLQYIKGMTFQYFFGTKEAIRLLHRK